MIKKSSFVLSLLYLASRGHACDESKIAVSTVTSTGTIIATTFVTSVQPSGSSDPSAASVPPVNQISAASAQNSAPSTVTSAVAAPVVPIPSATAIATQLATAATSGCKTYTVTKGDTGYAIAQAVGVTLVELNAQNPGMVWEKMEVGQILTLPPKATGANLGTSTDCKPASVVSAHTVGATGSAAAGNSPAPPSPPPPPPPPPAAAAASTASTASTASAASVASAPAVTAPAASGTASPPPAEKLASASSALLALAVHAITAGKAASAASASASSPAATAKTIGSDGADPVAALTHIGAVNDCSAAQFKDECVTAKDAAPHIVAGFDKYEINTPGEQAALLSLMIFESAGFMYNKKHFPQLTPGQGTVNMMSYNFVKEYIRSLSNELNGAAGGEPEDMLALVLKPEFSFASAAWFYTAMCSDVVKTGVKDGSVMGYEAYLKDCVGTEVTAERKAEFDKAREALGLTRA